MNVLRPLILSFALALGANASHAWEVPANPDPTTIINEAMADAVQGRPVDAAQKHLWYHENAIRLSPEHVQVRLTVALEEWVKLARRHAPAMQDILSVRERAIERVKGLDQQQLNDAMTEVVRINEALGDAASTRDTFLALAQRDSRQAARFWMYALPALTELNDHALANAFLHLPSVLTAINSQFASMTQGGNLSPVQRAAVMTQVSQYMDLTLARLVWVLVKSQRQPEAEDVAQRGKKMLGDTTATPLLDRALRGERPPVAATN